MQHIVKSQRRYWHGHAAEHLRHFLMHASLYVFLPVFLFLAQLLFLPI